MEREREELIQKVAREMMLSFKTLAFGNFRAGFKEHAEALKLHFKDKDSQGDFPWGLGHRHMGLFQRLREEKEGVAVKELAEAFQVTSGAITQMVDPLVERGLLERVEDQKDHRFLRVRLSEQAKEKYAAFRKRYLESVAPKFDNLSNREIETLKSLLEKLNNSQENK